MPAAAAQQSLGTRRGEARLVFLFIQEMPQVSCGLSHCWTRSSFSHTMTRSLHLNLVAYFPHIIPTSAAEKSESKWK